MKLSMSSLRVLPSDYLGLPLVHFFLSGTLSYITELAFCDRTCKSFCLVSLLSFDLNYDVFLVEKLPFQESGLPVSGNFWVLIRSLLLRCFSSPLFLSNCGLHLSLLSFWKKSQRGGGGAYLVLVDVWVVTNLRVLSLNHFTAVMRPLSSVQVCTRGSV